MLPNNTFSQLIGRIEKHISEPCQLCDAKTVHPSLLCAGCYSDLPSYHARCTICAIPLNNQQSLCGQCLANRPAFDRVYSPFLYQAPISNLIHKLKYQHQFYNLRLLSKFMSDHLHDHMQTRPDALVPVPLHPKRLRQRGFNQASELAARISKETGIPMSNNIIRRLRYTEAQTGLKPRQRKSNLAGAFTVGNKFLPPKILIVDDVMTTGATASEMAKCLKRHGAISVEIITVARADRR